MCLLQRASEESVEAKGEEQQVQDMEKEPGRVKKTCVFWGSF